MCIKTLINRIDIIPFIDFLNTAILKTTYSIDLHELCKYELCM